MTPDLTTPEGRAELRHVVPKRRMRGRSRKKPPVVGDRVSLGLRVSAATKETLENGANRSGRSLSQEAEMLIEAGLREALLLRVMAERDAAYAQIKRLTAPVTEKEGLAAVRFRDSWPKPRMTEVLEAFIASRKEPAP